MAFDLQRAQIGAWAMKFFKIGRLSVGASSLDSIRAAFDKRSDDKLHVVYEENVWAYRGINTIASSAGQVPLAIVEKTSSGKMEPVVDHPFLSLLETPNPFMLQQDIVELLMIFLEATGDGYWLFDDGGASGRAVGSKMRLKDVKEIWPLPSHEVTPTPDAKAFISNFQFKPGMAGEAETLSTAEVFHVRYPSPIKMMTGTGALKCLKNDLVADFYAAQFESFIMKNLAANVIFLKTDGSFTTEQEDEYRASLAKVFKNVRVAFMQSGLDFATPQIAAKDLPFLQLDERRQKRILGALGVPPIMVGSEGLKYDNAENQLKFFWGVTMPPKFSRIAGMLTKKLHELGESERLRVVFDTSGVKWLKDDYNVGATTAKLWVDMGYPLNSAIKTFGVPGMEEVEGGDVGLVQAALIPITDAIDPQVPLDPEGTPEDAPPPKPPKNGKEPAADPAEGKAIQEKGIVGDRALDDAHWKRFVATSEPGFRRLRAEVKRYFKGQRAKVLANVRAHYRKDFLAMKKEARIELILLDQNDATKDLIKRTRPLIRSIYEKLGSQAVGDVSASIQFNIDSPRAAEFLKDHVYKFAFEVNKTTRARLTTLLQNKFAEGASQGDLTDAISAEFDFYERFRAARIARTESGIAGNAGIMDGLVQAGVEAKRWISSRDEKVRHTHEVADGQEVGINEPFDVGGYLLDHPGDPDGPPEEIINCRCAVRAARS